MRNSAAPRRRSAPRPFAAAVVLALALVGLAPQAAHAADPIVGGTSWDAADPLVMTDRTATFTTSNIDRPSLPVAGAPWEYSSYWIDVVWYSFRPETSGTMDLTLTAIPSNYDTTLQIWTAAGAPVAGNDDCSGYNSCLGAVPLVGGTTYLIGVGGYRWGGYVSQGTATLTLTLSAPPTPPQDLVVVAGDGGAAVSWAPPSHTYGDLQNYAVYYVAEPGEPDLSTLPATQTSLELGGLTNGREYSVWVLVRNATGWSAATAPVRFTPMAVSTLTVTSDAVAPVSGDVLHLTWAVDVHGSPPAGTVDVTIGGVTTPGHPVVSALDVLLGAGPLEITVTYSGTVAILPDSMTANFTVAQLSQSVTFAALPGGLVHAGAPVTMVASSSESLLITFSASGSCSAAGDQLSLTGVGECTVTASQAGTSEVLPASATQVAQVAKRSQTLAVAGLPPVIVGNGQYTVTGTSSVGLPVTLDASGACTISGGVVTIVNVGTCTVTGSQAGDELTEPATAVATATVHGIAPTTSLRIGFAVGDQVEGSPVTVTGAGLRPDTALTLTVYSTPTQVGTATASVSGFAVSAGELPALAAGEHRVIARGTGLDGVRVSRVVRFAVDEAGIVTRIGAPADLADSGVTPDTPGLLALAWLVLGLGLIAVRRTVRRRTT